MKIILLSICVMLLFIPGLVFSESASIADHREKVSRLEALAEKFKAETGFTGQVERDNQRGCLYYIRGNFPNVSFADHADTLAIRQTFDAIIEKIIPYLGFEGLTLTKTRIGYNTTNTSTIYKQLVHGYSYEHTGEIIIGYSRDSDDLTISNGIISKHIPPVRVNYTFAQAIEITRQHYITVLGYPDTLSFEDTISNAKEDFGSIDLKKIRNNGTMYVYDNGEYRLCHILGVPDPYRAANGRGVYIDAQTGEVYKIVDGRIE